MPKSHGFYDEMTYLIEKGVITGFEDDTLRPDKTVSRAEAAIMIGRLKGFTGTASSTKFKDVTKNQKASGYIAAAEKAGYINGYKDGTFKPDAPITRGDMAVILTRVCPMNMRGIETFKDVSPNMGAYESIGQVVSANIAAGYKDKTFKPTAATTRGQFSAFLARALEPKFKNETHMEHSYLRDKTKTYTYQNADGELTSSYYVNTEDYFEEPAGFLWASESHEDGELSFYLEHESSEMYIVGFIESEFYIDLVYPIQKGKVFNVDNYYSPEHKITGVNVTVKTKYKTFTNAVEVTVAADSDYLEDGMKYYMVEGHGSVKSVALDGTVLSELVDVE